MADAGDVRGLTPGCVPGEVLRVGLAAAAVIEHTSTEQGDQQSPIHSSGYSGIIGNWCLRSPLRPLSISVALATGNCERREGLNQTQDKNGARLIFRLRASHRKVLGLIPA